jgi:hypothetical protein
MSDEADDAQRQIENIEKRSIEYASIEANKPIPLSDVCLFCGESTFEGRRFCDAFCRDEYQKRQALKR